jgi:hypothetical protein
MADYTGSFSGSFEGTFLGGVISSSAQLSIGWNSGIITDRPTTIQPFQANSIISNNRFREITYPAISASTSTRLTTVETNVSTLSGQIQAAVSGTVPPNTISGSPQIADLGYLTSASAAAAGFGSGVGLTISGSTPLGEQINKVFSSLQFDSSTGLNVTESISGTAFVSIGSHFRDIIVSGSSTLVATGSDSLEIIAGDGIQIFTSLSDTNGDGISKELEFRLDTSSQHFTNAVTNITLVSGIFTLTGSFYSTTNNIQITGSLSVGSGSFKSFEVDSDGFVVLGDMNKDLNNAPEGTIAYSGSSFYLIS